MILLMKEGLWQRLMIGLRKLIIKGYDIIHSYQKVLESYSLSQDENHFYLNQKINLD